MPKRKRRHHDKNHATTHTCPTCDHTFTGNYCNNCGEKVFHAHDLSFAHLAEETVDGFTHFDLKIPKSLLLLFNPGYLTQQFLKGIRVPFAKPVQLFIIANVIFFLFYKVGQFSDYAPALQDYNYYSLSDYDALAWAAPVDSALMRGMDDLVSHKLPAMVEKLDPDTARIKSDTLYRRDFEMRFAYSFYEKSALNSKLFIFLLVPLNAIFLYMLLFKHFKYFGAAFIFAIHYTAFNILTFGLDHVFDLYAGFSPFKPLMWLFSKTPLQYPVQFIIGTESNFELFHLLFLFPYLLVAFYRLFRLRWYWNIPLSFLMARITFYLSFGVYKKILIALTLWLSY